LPEVFQKYNPKVDFGHFEAAKSQFLGDKGTQTFVTANGTRKKDPQFPSEILDGSGARTVTARYSIKACRGLKDVKSRHDC
jgi:hypothetical protein